LGQNNTECRFRPEAATIKTTRKTTGFESKLLARLSRLDADQIQPFLEQTLQQNQFLLDVLDRLNEGVIVTDADLELLFANPKARSMLGLPRRRGQQTENLGELLSQENPLAEIIDSLRGNLRQIEGYESPYGRNRDRFVSLTTLLMNSAANPAAPPDPDEPPRDRPLLIILLQDVTERRLRMSEQERARRLASMATLTSGIAHEIKNPLNSLNIHAQLLREEADRSAKTRRPADSEKLNRAAAVILEETQRLGRIVDDFIQAARPSQPHLEERPIGPFLQHAADLFGPECSHAGITLVVNIEPDLPPIYFDEHLLMQALRNLVRNAIDALTEQRIRKGEESTGEASGSGDAPTLELSATLTAESVNLTVADNGPGIDMETLEQIMEPYFTTKFHGSGLGLMVVYRIVTEHKGALHVDTHPGEGARFTISLPLHQKPLRLLEEKEPEATAERQGS
jgi:signal transduction histidine kinase